MIPSYNIKLLLSFFFAFNVFTCYVMADSRDLSTLSFEELSEVKITSASKRSETVSNSPATVTVISSDEIRRFGFRTLSEALSTVPGFVGSFDRNYEYIGVRGFARPGDFNTRVLILVNGHRINDVNYNYAGVGYDFPVDLESIERIEVVKGPGSALWGTSALLSVVNVITKSGEKLSGKKLTLESGSNSRIRGLAEYGELTDGGLNVYSSISGFGTHGEDSVRLPGIVDSNGLPAYSINNDSENAYRALLTASYDKFSIMFNSHSRKKNVPITPDMSPHLVDEDIFNTYDFSNRFEARYDSALNSNKTDLLTARLYSDYNSFNGEYPYSDDTGTGKILNFDNSRSTRYGAELIYTRPLLKTLNLSVGSEYQSLQGLRFRNYNYDPEYQPDIDLINSYDEIAAFTELRWDVVDWLSLVGGVRYTDYASQIEKVNPRAAMIVKASDDTTFKFLYGSAFRAPNNYELNYESESQGFESNPSIEAESLDSYEFAVEQTISTNHFVNLSVYKFTLDKLINSEFIQTPNGQISRFENIPGAEIRV